MNDERKNDERLPDDFWRLAADACDETLSAADQQRLDTLLASDEYAAHAYTEYCNLHCELHFFSTANRAADRVIALIEAEEKAGTKAKSGKRKAEEATTYQSPVTAHQSRLRSWSQFLTQHKLGTGIAAGLVFVVVVIGWAAFTYLPNVAQNEESQEETPAEWIALLENTHEAEWLDGTKPPAHRPRLMPGQRLAISTGLLEINYRTGAKVIIEGPADFTVGAKDEGGRMKAKVPEIHPSSFTLHPSNNSGYLKLGKLTARCDTKDSQGFTVETPMARIEDLGTEFGINVNLKGTTNAVVSEGSVRVGLQDGSGHEQILYKGQAARIDFVSRGAGSPEIKLVHVEENSSAALPRMLTRLKKVLDGQQVLQPLSALHAGSERVALVANGGFDNRGVETPPGSGGFPFPSGWSRRGDMFAAGPPPRVVVPSSCYQVLARASINRDMQAEAYERYVDLLPDTEYVLSAYLWNLGDAHHRLIANVDLGDAQGEARLRLAVEEEGASEGCFAYHSFKSSETGTRVRVRVFYDTFSETNDQWPHFPFGAMWDNIAITPAADFQPPYMRGNSHEDLSRVE